MKMLRIKYIALIVVTAGVLGGIVGWYIRNDRFLMPKSVPTATSMQVRVNSPKYPLINPLLYSENAKDTSTEYKDLASRLNTYIDITKKAGIASGISVYFRDLNSGNWTGANENDTYTPASMLKVVAMMAALKLAETDPAILDEKLYYQATSTDGEYYPSEDNLSSGMYSVQNLIAYMIIYSDNAAVDALLSNASINTEFTNIYDIFRLPSSSVPHDYMSPKSYAVIFRTLYNSTLFQWDLSEQVLNLLTKTNFKAGLVAGVPAKVSIAHKFGESNDILPNGQIEHELHDCGIIYYPDDPYLLCVMTRGKDFSQLQSVISSVSKTVYDFVDGENAFR